MARTFDEMLNGEATEAETPQVRAQQVAPTGEEATEKQATVAKDIAPAQVDGDEDDDALPTEAQPGERAVPLKALENVRAEKKDWKEKAIRAEERAKRLETVEKELADMKARIPQAPQQGQTSNAPVSQDDLVFNERLNMSEIMAREKYTDMDEKLAAFQAAVAQNPAMGLALRKQIHPWDYVYKEGAKLLAMQAIGDDPTAYAKRIRDEIEAEMRAKFEAGEFAPAPTATTAQPTNRPNIPQSLAGARSSAPRGGASYTGPTPFDSLTKH